MRRKNAPTAEIQNVRPINPRLHKKKILKDLGEKCRKNYKRRHTSCYVTCNDSNNVNALRPERDFFLPASFAEGPISVTVAVSRRV